MDKLLLTPEEAAEVLGVGRSTVFELIRLAAMLARAAIGLPAVEASTKLGAYLEQWLEDVVRPQVRRRTYEAYRTCVERHVTPALGRKQLRNLTPVDVRTLLNSKHRSSAGRRWVEHDLVFPSLIGTPMDPRNLNREFGSLLRRAQVGVRIKVNKDGAEELVPRIRLHDLRHTCATFLVAQGVPLRAVMEILGHSGIVITSDTYSHVLPTLLSDAADKMNDLLDDGEEGDD